MLASAVNVLLLQGVCLTSLCIGHVSLGWWPAHSPAEPSPALPEATSCRLTLLCFSYSTPTVLKNPALGVRHGWGVGSSLTGPDAPEARWWGRGGRLVCWFWRWVVEVDEAPSNPLPAAQDPASRPRPQGDAAHPLPGSAPGIQVWAKVTDLLQLSFQEG